MKFDAGWVGWFIGVVIATVLVFAFSLDNVPTFFLVVGLSFSGAQVARMVAP